MTIALLSNIFRRPGFATLAAAFLPLFVSAQATALRRQIADIAKTKHATVGVAIYNLDTGDTLTYANGHHYPMQSVFKFPLAISILHNVDQGKLSLGQKIRVTKSDLVPDTWSPLREKYPDGNIDLTLAELLDYTVSKSDNNTCDILFKLVGGPVKVDRYLHSIGIRGMNVRATEEGMRAAWEVQYTNWTTPFAAAQLLYKFYKEHILSPGSRKVLYELMINSTNATDRLKGQLPKDALVAHKTGTSNRNEQGVRAATNDIGIITLPNNTHIAIAVFVSDSKETNETNAAIIASIAKTAWDYSASPTR